MAFSLASLLLRRRSCVASSPPKLLPLLLVSRGKIPPFPPSARSLSATPLPLPSDRPDSPKPSLSARLSFVFDQIDAIDRDRAAKDAALQRIRDWHQNKPPQPPAADGKFVPPATYGSTPSEIHDLVADVRANESVRDVLRKEVELVHPWPEWIELMERLAQQNYFDFRRTDEERVAENLSIDLSSIKEEMGFDFSRDWTTVRNACMNLGRDRFDILRSLSRKDLQVLVGHGCPSMDPKVVFSAKLLRKLVHLDEGDVCSSCSLRNSCGRGYILTRKEDEARTLDVMRVLLTFGFDHVKETVENKPLMKMKFVKTVVRKLLHEIVKLSAIPIDPNLPPPIIKKPPPKCDAKRPKRQLLPGEWECPRCNFLNYRRNLACFHCDHKRPPDEYTDNQMHLKQSGPRTRLERATRMRDVSHAWNFDFDDNESDGADVAAFEFADFHKSNVGSSDNRSHRGTDMEFEDDTSHTARVPRTREQDQSFKEADERRSTFNSYRTGFDDFDDEEDDDVDSYELDSPRASEVSRMNYSELEQTSESEDFEEFDHSAKSNQGAKDYASDSEDDARADQPYWRPNHAADARRKSGGRGHTRPFREMPFDSDDDYELGSDSDEMDGSFRSKQGKGHQENLHRASRGRISDSNDGSLLGMQSDDDDLRSRGNKKRGKSTHGGSQREFPSTDRINGRRNSSVSGHDGLSSRGLHMRGRGPGRGGGHGNFRENERFQHFDRQVDRKGFGFRQQGRRNQFPSNGTRGSRTNVMQKTKQNKRGNATGILTVESDHHPVPLHRAEQSREFLDPERTCITKKRDQFPTQVKSNRLAADEHGRHRRVTSHQLGESLLHLSSPGVLVQLVDGGIDTQVMEETLHGVAHAAGAQAEDYDCLLGCQLHHLVHSRRTHEMWLFE
ncbi:Zn-finger in Ran binding protein [Musa troglodytarum]|uniref:Zn-finger in Ran binding protein n=1 Tax=Musa troglodytarum TaxID=320322 RepID=A0A9E7JHD9_9LILI|nr:Zn-finger in Ran binding protein [Musa troglodytarum]